MKGGEGVIWGIRAFFLWRRRVWDAEARTLSHSVSMSCRFSPSFTARLPLPLHLEVAQDASSVPVGQQGVGIPKGLYHSQRLTRLRAWVF